MKMYFFIICSFIFVSSLCVNVTKSDAELLNLYFEFTYDYGAYEPAVAYHLYCRGVLVHIVDGDSLNSMSDDFFVESNGDTVLPFYITAIHADGKESPSSDIYNFEVIPNEPLKAPSDFKIDIQISNIESSIENYQISIMEPATSGLYNFSKEACVTFDTQLSEVTKQLTFIRKATIKFLC